MANPGVYLWESESGDLWLDWGSVGGQVAYLDGEPKAGGFVADAKAVAGRFPEQGLPPGMTGFTLLPDIDLRGLRLAARWREGQGVMVYVAGEWWGRLLDPRWQLVSASHICGPAARRYLGIHQEGL